MALPDYKIKEWTGGALPDFRVAYVADDAVPAADFTYEVVTSGADYVVQVVAENAVPRPDFRLRLAAGGGGGGQTTLRRETDGTVTVLALGTPFTPTLTRQPDGSVIVSG